MVCDTKSGRRHSDSALTIPTHLLLQGHAYLAAPDRGGSRGRFLDRAKSLFEVEPQPNFCAKADAALTEWQQAQKTKAKVPDDLEGYNPDLHHPHLSHLRRRLEP